MERDEWWRDKEGKHTHTMRDSIERQGFYDDGAREVLDRSFVPCTQGSWRCHSRQVRGLRTPVKIQGLKTRSTYAMEAVRKHVSLLSIWERSLVVSLLCSSFQQIGGCCPHAPRWIFFICLSAVGENGIFAQSCEQILIQSHKTSLMPS